MSSVHCAQVHVSRHSPPYVRKTPTKAARSTPPSKSAGAPKITLKGARSTEQVKDGDTLAFEPFDDDMVSSFLQFCAMCEKQIVVPNSSILYCSESCRRRDAQVSATSPYLALTSPTKMTSGAFDFDDSFGSKAPIYVPAMQPTPRLSRDSRIPPMAHDGKSDLDPTEWKPAEPKLVQGKTLKSKSYEWKPKLVHRPSSEAFQYLSKFHPSSDSLSTKRRPGLVQSRSTYLSHNTPSLTHTPTASTSSEESLTGTPYEFVARPAISMPTTATTTGASEGLNVAGVGDKLTYEKKHVGASLGSATGSLKKLLGTP